MQNKNRKLVQTISFDIRVSLRNQCLRYRGLTVCGHHFTPSEACADSTNPEQTIFLITITSSLEVIGKHVRH